MAVHDASEFFSIAEMSEGLRGSRYILRVMGPLIQFLRILGDCTMVAFLNHTTKQRPQCFDRSRRLIMEQVLFDGIGAFGLSDVGFKTNPGVRTEFFFVLFEKLSSRRRLPRFSERLNFNGGDSKRRKCGFNFGPVLGDQFGDRARIIAV